MKSISMGFSEQKQGDKRMQADREASKAVQEGLLICKGCRALFQSLQIGEARNTLYVPGSNASRGDRKVQRQSKIGEQWWAPARFVRFNVIMERLGFSHKVRSRALRCMLNNKPFPADVQDAVAEYVENTFDTFRNQYDALPDQS